MKVLSKFVRSIDVAASTNGAISLISSAVCTCRPGLKVTSLMAETMAAANSDSSVNQILEIRRGKRLRIGSRKQLRRHAPVGTSRRLEPHLYRACFQAACPHQ